MLGWSGSGRGDGGGQGLAGSCRQRLIARCRGVGVRAACQGEGDLGLQRDNFYPTVGMGLI